MPLDGASQGLSVTLSPDGRFAYFPRRPTASGTPGFVQVLDTTTNTIIATTTVGLTRGRLACRQTERSCAIAERAVERGAPAEPGDACLRRDDSHPGRIRRHLSAQQLPRLRGRWRRTSSRLIRPPTPSPPRYPSSVSSRGYGPEGGATAVVATPPPSLPPDITNFQATAIAGNRVTLTWTAPVGASPTGYVVEGGVGPGEVLGSLPTGSAAPTLAFDAPSGTLYVRVHALTASGRSAASNEIRILVNLPQPPSPPTGLLGLANGANLALNWKAGAAGGPSTSFILDVSGALTLSMPIGAARASHMPACPQAPTPSRSEP